MDASWTWQTLSDSQIEQIREATFAHIEHYGFVVQHETLLAKASEVAIGDMGYIPLYHPSLIFAAKKGLEVEVRADGHSNAFQQMTK